MVKNPFTIWLILDLTVNIFAVLALVPIITGYYKGPMIQTFLIVLFIVWAFRPLILAFKESFK